MYLQVHIAAANCYEDALEFLVESGAAVDIVDKDGWQPIHGAAVWGNVSTL
jgi:ankyrin repeat protein